MSMPVAMPGSRAAHVFVGLAEEFAWSAVYGDFGHPGSIPLPAPGAQAQHQDFFGSDQPWYQLENPAWQSSV